MTVTEHAKPATPANREPAGSTTGQQWPALKAFSGHQRDGGLGAWLAVMEGTLKAIERTAWQGRQLADQALVAWRAFESGAGGVADECQELAREAKRWPARLKRLSITGWMLTRVLASYRLWGTRSAFLPSSMRQSALDALHRKNARRFRKTSLEQGGAFLKIGQILSSRPDLLPAAWVEELAQLQDQARPESFEAVRAVIEAEFDAPLEQLFEQFDPEPLAAASIGQVHRARLPDGRQVAVKVQRPGLDDVIELDLSLLKIFIDSVRGALPPMDFDTIIGEIQRTVRDELDYRGEARAMRQVRAALDGKDAVTVPATVDHLCSRRVLTSEFIDGRKLTTVLDEYRQQGRDEAIAATLHTLLDAWFHQVLVGGVFQADPHPGNLLVEPSGRLVVLDFGCTMTLPEPFRRGYLRVLQASIVGERQVIAETLNELGFVTRSGEPDTLLAFTDALLDQLRDGLLTAGNDGSQWPGPEQVMAQVRDLLIRMGDDPVEKIPAEFVMLARVFGTLGGLFLHYQPRVDMARLVLAYLSNPATLGEQAPVAAAPSPWWRRWRQPLTGQAGG
ncbi:ABC1 kinase family protein [Alloalcanivorax gelatiniphagus]|uniref:AarF/ABC1/UbiB kinase family protein n=1 Tax=Alloalcanivorax gelatiniphagus TaxID=1194167 RepID=A0ABY2XNC2_9GAMM|nr:AarF/UbiB family protein [Alloalcanivorax gelatiniphagus]TMW13001.1 AarF/ABC1/UbiB kinase family protein [Alloalcanivorax gelatiniphagus]